MTHKPDRKEIIVRGLCPTMHEGINGHVIMEFVFYDMDEARHFVEDRKTSYRDLHIKQDKK